MPDLLDSVVPQADPEAILAHRVPQVHHLHHQVVHRHPLAVPLEDSSLAVVHRDQPRGRALRPLDLPGLAFLETARAMRWNSLIPRMRNLVCWNRSPVLLGPRAPLPPSFEDSQRLPPRDQSSARVHPPDDTLLH